MAFIDTIRYATGTDANEAAVIEELIRPQLPKLDFCSATTMTYRAA